MEHTVTYKALCALRRRTPFINALMVSVAMPTLAIAQQAPDIKVEEIIVEGQVVTEQISEIAVDFARFGTQVQVINSFEIETGGFTNFGELASGLIRGANIGYSPDEGEFTIRIDGGTDRDTLLLLDGVPTFDRGTPLETIWGATVIDPRMIESVEIFRGGQSLYYGGNGGLGVVNVRYKEPDGTNKGQFGAYAGSFKTREIYGNYTFPIDQEGRHSLMVFGRSYETDAHNLFNEESYVDTVLELGGKHEFPYSYNLIGAKYLFQVDADTEFRLGGQFGTVDFRDSFPNSHVFNPNYTEFPIFDAKFKTRFSDRIGFEAEAYYTEPKLSNTEVDAQICRIPQGVINPATGSRFTLASDYEAFAAANGLPIGCVTNPESSPRADGTSRDGFYVDANGNILGTLENPFRIGDPMGTVIQSIAGFGTGIPTKGYGDGTQFKAGYRDYGANARAKIEWTDYLETVVGAQYTAYQDASADVYGLSNQTVRSTGVYGDVRAELPLLEGTSVSFAVRNDFNSAFQDEFIWKYGIRQELPGGFYLRSNGGTSYSNPTLTETGARPDRAENASLETQRVENYNFGAGINGEVWGGTFNIEVGYFDTVIDNLFGTDQIRDVCPGVDPFRTINPNIKTPTELCANFASLGLSPLDTAVFNTLNKQDIEGFTIDIALDLDQWQLDLSYTDQKSLEPNPVFGATAIRAGSGQVLTTVVPGEAGSNEFRQSSERPEWMLSGLITYTPTDRWILSANPRLQGPEATYVQNTAARLVDANGNRTNPDLNIGDYFLLNASVQYLMGDNLEHRFMLRIVNVTDEKYFERGGATDQQLSRAGIRGELGPNDPNYYYTYGWNGKPRSFWLQYEYNF
ncbi:MAG: TonB-dependent receptor plug domain-containing protein [Rhodospirillaceae bacterium]